MLDYYVSRVCSFALTFKYSILNYLRLNYIRLAYLRFNYPRLTFDHNFIILSTWLYNYYYVTIMTYNQVQLLQINDYANHYVNIKNYWIHSAMQ